MLTHITFWLNQILGFGLDGGNKKKEKEEDIKYLKYIGCKKEVFGITSTDIYS